MTHDNGFVIQLLFDQRLDGRFHVHSPDVSGLHLAGDDLEAIRADISPVLKDILLHNSKMVVDEIEWHSSLEDVVRRMTTPTPPPDEPPQKPTTC
jgi:predicted RNase H-like HicB family nuclease